MRCINPLVKTPLGFAEKMYSFQDRNVYVCKGSDFNEEDVVLFPCRKCFYCQKDRVREWYTRCWLESKRHKDSCILTLTYENSPRSVNKRDCQLFLKRLRKAIEPIKVSYLICGEYGSEKKRPHYHMILFGYCFPDCVYMYENKGKIYYRSSMLERLWTKGLCSIDNKVSSKSIKYVVGYTVGKSFQIIPKGVEEPFQLMSRRPAIGRVYYDENRDSIYSSDKVYIDGKSMRPCKYYDRKYIEDMPEEGEVLKAKRKASVQKKEQGIAFEIDVNKATLKHEIELVKIGRNKF